MKDAECYEQNHGVNTEYLEHGQISLNKYFLEKEEKSTNMILLENRGYV